MGITSVCLCADEKEPGRKVELQESQDTCDKASISQLLLYHKSFQNFVA